MNLSLSLKRTNNIIYARSHVSTTSLSTLLFLESLIMKEYRVDVHAKCDALSAYSETASCWERYLCEILWWHFKTRTLLNAISIFSNAYMHKRYIVESRLDEVIWALKHQTLK